MIKTYPDQSAYAAAGLPERETRVANITEGNLTKVDGVNVEKNVQTPPANSALSTATH